MNGLRFSVNAIGKHRIKKRQKWPKSEENFAFIFLRIWRKITSKQFLTTPYVRENYIESIVEDCIEMNFFTFLDSQQLQVDFASSEHQEVVRLIDLVECRDNNDLEMNCNNINNVNRITLTEKAPIAIMLKKSAF